MTDMGGGEPEPYAYASVCRSPLDRRVWVPIIADDDHDSSTWAGGLRKVMAYVRRRVSRFETGVTGWTWEHTDEDTWTLYDADEYGDTR